MLTFRFLRVTAPACLASFLLASVANAEIVTKTVEYKLPSGEGAKGIAVYDESAQGRRPGVLVVPEWWGLNAYPKMRARQLAEMGYVAFVADMYGNGQTTDDPKKAQEWAGKAGKSGLAKLAQPALDELKKMEQVDAEKIAAIGFCFGGSTVADMIKNGVEFQAGVSFHGGLGPDAAPARGREVKTALLVLHGGDDPMVPAEQLSQFVQRSIEAGVPLTVVNFPGAVHAFSNPEADKHNLDGVKYDEQAEKLSWHIMGQFLTIMLGGEHQVAAGQLPQVAQTYMIGGHVDTPGIYTITPGMTLREAVAPTGVPDFLDKPGTRIKLVRGSEEIIAILPIDEGESWSTPLRKDDVVLVGAAK